MKPYVAALCGAVLAPGAVGHQLHGILLVNGTASPEWKYVRDVAPASGAVSPIAGQYEKTIPQFDVHNPNITCGRNAFDYANQTETATVLAGSEVGFRVSYDYQAREEAFFIHPGPGQVYLSRAPNDNLESYRGDGDWFKIAYGGPVSNNEWSLYFNFTIPETTPPGRYLMRFEQFWPTTSYNYSQWFINCAHVNIVGPGGGIPTGFAKFPGTYEVDDPGILIPENQHVISGLEPDEMALMEYKPPGPPVWTG
ncbi:Cellulose-growth-specific protein [Madurella mycetomatis]|uniref:lytic cellulose monooxygenase (C4-dehydrogenating) n=1 Tax=Madurella mycetomatis TaxID=100816 RepID=A0A175WBW7_9PEZI|nr:Cellulose-growth-specific protein [Madurella mycetomatis]